MAFHDEIDSAYTANPGYRFVPIVGTDQPTSTTCRLIGRRAVLDRTIDGDDEKGDGTVPRFCARSLWMRMLASLTVRTWLRKKAPPAGAGRGLGVRAGVALVSLT